MARPGNAVPQHSVDSQVGIAMIVFRSGQRGSEATRPIAAVALCALFAKDARPACRSSSLACWLNRILASRLSPAVQSNPRPGPVIAQSSIHESSETPPSAFCKYSRARHERVDAAYRLAQTAAIAATATAAVENKIPVFLPTWPHNNSPIRFPTELASEVDAGDEEIAAHRQPRKMHKPAFASA